MALKVKASSIFLCPAWAYKKNRARLTPGPVNSCFYCLIFKRTFFHLKKDLSFHSGAGPRGLLMRRRIGVWAIADWTRSSAYRIAIGVKSATDGHRAASSAFAPTPMLLGAPEPFVAVTLVTPEVIVMAPQLP